MKLDRLTLALLIGLELVQNFGTRLPRRPPLTDALTLMAFARIYVVGRSFVRNLSFAADNQDLGAEADCFSTWESA